MTGFYLSFSNRPIREDWAGNIIFYANLNPRYFGLISFSFISTKNFVEARIAVAMAFPSESKAVKLNWLVAAGD